jgi:hypothetical protein
MNVHSGGDPEVFQAEAMVSQDISHHLIGQGLGPAIITGFCDLIIYHGKIIDYQFTGFQKQAAAV